jgi:hypothetical protein
MIVDLPFYDDLLTTLYAEDLFASFLHGEVYSVRFSLLFSNSANLGMLLSSISCFMIISLSHFLSIFFPILLFFYL